MKRLLFLLCVLLAGKAGKSQTLADTIRNEIAAMNHAYDSAFYLTFDVGITYDSDTLWAGTDSADFNHSTMEGTYTFHKNKALYKLGDIEYMQNDSFTIALYKDNKFILVGKPVALQKPGMFMPTRNLFDSLMTQLELEYQFWFLATDSIKTIGLTALDTNSVYEKIVIEYEPVTNYLIRVKYSIKDLGFVASEMPTLGGSSGPAPIMRNVLMTFDFKNYRVEQVGSAVFDEAKYIFFDGPGLMVPAEAYKNYTIYKNY